MSKKITLSEEQLTNVIKNILEQEMNDDETLLDIDDLDTLEDEEDDMESLED